MVAIITIIIIIIIILRIIRITNRKKKMGNSNYVITHVIDKQFLVEGWLFRDEVKTWLLLRGSRLIL